MSKRERARESERMDTREEREERGLSGVGGCWGFRLGFRVQGAWSRGWGDTSGAVDFPWDSNLIPQSVSIDCLLLLIGCLGALY